MSNIIYSISNNESCGKVETWEDWKPEPKEIDGSEQYCSRNTDDEDWDILFDDGKKSRGCCTKESGLSGRGKCEPIV